jgi:hypothetical protein
MVAIPSKYGPEYGRIDDLIHLDINECKRPAPRAKIPALTPKKVMFVER